MIRRYLLFFFAVLTVVILVLGVVFSFVVRGPIRDSVEIFWSAVTLPEELSKAIFFSNGVSGERTLRVSGQGFQEVTPPEDPSLQDVKNDVVARVSKRENNTSALSLSGATLFVSTLPLGNISLSQNTRKIAFTQEGSGALSKQSNISDARSVLLAPSTSRVIVVSPDWKDQKIIGPGLAPLFLDNDNVIRLSPVGLVVTNLSTQRENILLDKSLEIIDGPVLYSLDRTLIAFGDGKTRSFFVYRISKDSAVLVKEIANFEGKFVLGNEVLYELKGGNRGETEIWKYSFDEKRREKIHSFPQTLGISNLAF